MRQRPPRRPVYRPFLYVSLAIALTMGFATGTALLLAPALGLEAGLWWITHAQGHGVAQLFGWIGLFTMGVAYHAVPRFRNVPLAAGRLATPSLLLIAGGILLRQGAQGLSHLSWGAVLLVIAGAALLAGVALFAAVMALTLRSGPREHEPFEFWLMAGLAWALVAGALHLGVVIAIAVTGTRLAPPALDTAFVHATLYGFLLTFIAGISFRIVPPFMRLGPPRRRLAYAALALLGLGVGWQTAVWTAAGNGSYLWTWGAFAQAAAMAMVPIALGVFRRRPQLPEYGPGAYRRYEVFVRTAYAWLLLAGVLWAYRAAADVLGWQMPIALSFSIVRHIVALGTLTLLVFGIATRILPAFEGARLQLPGLMDAAYVLLNASVVLRVAFTLVPVPISPVFLAVSGVLGLAALCCFAVVVWRTMRPAAREDYRQMIDLHVGRRTT